MSMRAVQITGPRACRLCEIDEPELCAGDVRIQVLGSGICATDVEIFEGDMVYFTRGMASWPVVPGHEWVGRILEIGQGVTGFEIGMHVVGEVSLGCGLCASCKSGNYHRCPTRCETGILNRPGSFAQFIHHPAHYLHQIDSSVPVAAAALVEPTAVAFNGVLRAQVSPQDYVVVFGDGPIGLLLLQVAKAFGARKVAVVGASDHRLAKARELQADLVIDARKEDVVDTLMQAGSGALPGVVLEATGRPDAAFTALHSVCPGGRVVFQGLFAGQPLPGFDLDQIVINDLTVLGALGSPNIWPDVIGLIESGKVNPAAIVSDELPLDAFSAGLEKARTGSGIKVLIKP